MLVPYSQAFILHEARITDLDQMARHLNPLDYEDFRQHHADVVSWVEKAVNDKYLAQKLRNTWDQEKFVELLFLRQSHLAAKDAKDNLPSKKELKQAELERVEEKLSEMDLQEELEVKPEIKPSPEHKKAKTAIKKPEIKDTKNIFHYDYFDFKELIDQAAHCIKQKHFEDALKIYGKLKEEFDRSKLTPAEKRKIHRQITTIFDMIEHSLS